MDKQKKEKSADISRIEDAKQNLRISWEGIDLKPQEIRFVSIYCTNGFNALNAYIESGMSHKDGRTPGLAAYHVTRDPIITLAIQRFVDEAIKPYRARLEYEILEIYYKRATYQVKTFYTPDGAIIPLDEIPEEWHCCIDGITTRLWGAMGLPITSYELPNRDTALQTLLKLMRDYSADDNPGLILPQETQKRLNAIWNAGNGHEVSITAKIKRGPGRPRKVN